MRVFVLFLVCQFGRVEESMDGRSGGVISLFFYSGMVTATVQEESS